MSELGQIATEPPVPAREDGAERVAAAAAGAPKKRSRARIVLPVLVFAAIGVGVGVYLRGAGKESTDDAFVEAHVANIAARVPGSVVKVNVKDDEIVDTGQVLVELDDRDARVRVEQAKADLEASRASLAAAERQLAFIRKSVEANLRQAQGGVTQAVALTQSTSSTIDQAQANVDVAKSRLALADIDLKRAMQLRADNSISQAELDSKKATYEQAEATLKQAEANLAGTRVGVTNAAGNMVAARGRLLAAMTGPEQIDNAEAQVKVARARVMQSEASLASAELNLTYMQVKAPIRGQIARRTVEPGQSAAPERPLLSISNIFETWIVANFKEDQTADIRPGQRVRITIDALGSRVFEGHVESIAGGTGSRFALLPPDNASGNFTKVVQRIPVLIRLDQKSEHDLLRPGMSAYVTVITR